MTTVRQYTGRLRTGTERVALRFGCDLTGAPNSMRAVVMGVLVMLAVVVKVLVDNGAMTDAQLTAAFNAAEDEEQTPEPHLP